MGWNTIKIKNETIINTSGMESSPAFIGDKIGFVSSPESGKEKRDGLNELYYDLVQAQVLFDNSLGEISRIHPKINTELHEGPMCYDAMSNTLYFTRSHKERRLRKGRTIDTSYLRIMSADLNVSKPKIEPVNINVDNFSVAHPTLSKDGKMMIFSSNQPNGRGGMDLYVSYLEGTTWSIPNNLGNEINTSYHEIFPYLLNDTLLLFASNRPGGLGGLDIYVTIKKNYIWQTPELLPQPLNSPYDDLGMIVRENTMSGYFASNRPGGKGKDDIYSFQSIEPLFGIFENKVYISQLELLDKLTFEPVDNAMISISPIEVDINDFILSSFNVDVLSGRDPGDIFLKLTPQNNASIIHSVTDDRGKIQFKVKKNKKYLISVKADQYKTLNILYDYDLIGQEFNLVMEPSETEDFEDDKIEDFHKETTNIDLPTKKGSVIVFENIYYAYNSSQILEDATSELRVLAQVMEVNPEINIRIESHTDSRGAEAYNLQLSIKRAEAVRNFLIEKGIDEDRMVIRGYGESRLRNQCKDGIKCSEEQHKFNRRTEIVIE